MALIGITIEWNVISIRMNASPSTKANTTGVRTPIRSLKSTDAAVPPVTPTSTPWICPTVAGTTLSRRVFSACWDSASLPSPASGMLTRATVWSGLTVTSIGLFISPVARAWRFS